MTRFVLNPNETLQIVFEDSRILQQHAPQILAALPDCIDAINERYVEIGEKPALELLFL